MKKRMFAGLLALALLAGLAACKKRAAEPPAPGTDTPSGEAAQKNDVVWPAALAYEDFDARRALREENGVTEDFAAALADFSYKTAQALRAEGENTLYSPLSLYCALALTAQGAAGETREQLLTLLGARDADALAESCGKLLRLLYRDSDMGKLRIANSLWLSDVYNGKAVTYGADFLKTAAEDFYAAAFSADFTAPAAAEAMGRWIAEQTGGLLTPAIETDPAQLLAILNTVWLSDQWVDRFYAEETAPGTFHAAAGDVEADFMHRTALTGFARGDGFTRAGLGLKECGEMVFILPDEGVSVGDLITQAGSLAALFTGGEARYGRVEWAVPKFSASVTMELSNLLKGLGVTDAFAPETADFSALSDCPAYISGVRQDARIAVDEQGVEAAAFTLIAMAGSGMPEETAEMNLDRPFLYAIVQNGVPLFIGVCENP